MEEIVIRTAEEKDWEQLPDLMKGLREHLQQWFPLASWENTAQGYIDQTKEYLDKEEGIIYVADTGRNLVGYTAGCITEENDFERHPDFLRRGWIEDIYVTPDYQSSGIGKKLIQKIVEDLTTKNVSYISLGVLLNNSGAIDFYKKCGFESYFLNMKIDIKYPAPYLKKS
jgi:ribosomal protein S18 acetylase RimI-like enzyme